MDVYVRLHSMKRIVWAFAAGLVVFYTPYAGLGPAAHEFDGRVRRWNVAAYVDWMRRANAGQDPVDACEQLSSDNRIAEQVYLGLRTAAGLAVSGPEIARVRTWEDSGWSVLHDGDRATLTPLGWLRLDTLAADLTLIRSRS